jgi:hypothetical protein
MKKFSRAPPRNRVDLTLAWVKSTIVKMLDPLTAGPLPERGTD